MTKPSAPFTVFFDGACPLCVREIGYFQRRKPAGVIQWVDVSARQSAPDDLPVNRCDALKRFHIQDEQGQLKSGAAAFAALWQRYPGFRILGHFVALPGVRLLAEGAYRLFLGIRPVLQAIARHLVPVP